MAAQSNTTSIVTNTITNTTTNTGILVDEKQSSLKNELTNGDLITAIGLVITFVLGVWNFIQNHRISKRTQFINTVTSERVKWIQELRKNISDLSGAIHTWAMTYANAQLPDQREGEKELLERIDRLKYLIRLQLNPKDYPDNEIEVLIKLIPTLTNTDILDPLMTILEGLTVKTQILLKKEWEKVKAEAIAGKLLGDHFSRSSADDRS